MKKHIAAVCLLGTALSAPAFPQEATPSSSQPMSTSTASAAGGQFVTQMDAQQWRGSKLVGVDVYGSDNSKIGDINEVIVDRNGQARAIVIGVGGFLGIGEKNVAIAWDKVQWNMGGAASGSMASSTSAGGQPAGDRSSPRDIAQTTTGAPADRSAQAPQTVATGGATLSAPPATSDNSAPATTTTGVSPAASASTQAQDYPDRALVSMSKQDLQNAPEFKYASQSNAGAGAASSGSTGSNSGR
jgi:sporulation protein YlmC with PRC-barrel domain